MGRTRFEGYLRADRHFGESKTGPAGLQIGPNPVCLFVGNIFFAAVFWTSSMAPYPQVREKITQKEASRAR